VSRTTESEAVRRIEDSLNKSPRRMAARGDVETTEDEDDEAEAA
jgi:CarD family transcriptional regulator